MSSPPFIRSYVLRQGYYSDAQRRAYATLLPCHGIPFSENPVDLTTLFGRTAPKILEIGSGMGETTAAIAQLHPEKDFVAVEVHTPGVGSLLNRIQQLNLTNLKIIACDAHSTLQRMLPDESLDGVHIFFPDPWPKKRHHKRRLIQPDFVSLLTARMKPGAYLHIATDWENYAEHILQVLNHERQLSNTVSDYAIRPSYRPLTKFEQRGLKLGHVIRDMIFLKR
ncbi:MAG: tRNA (guanosine(46)-N7)-methyltransferase TrmB [Nitrosomonas sp.]|nr:tRNA (guanosine(46)-N7)-methyltransferase TrmB [Nitrosomonas sp.]